MKSSPSSLLMPVLFFVLLIVAPAGVMAQAPSRPMQLEASQYKLNRLAPGVLNDQAVFRVDQSDVVMVEIIANGGEINTSILSPNGQVIDPNTVGGMGGSFQLIDDNSQQSGMLILPTLTKGLHYLYTFPSQGSGDYTVRYQAASNPSGEIAIFTHLKTNSKIGVAFFATAPTVTLGSPAVLSAALFNQKTPIAGASISVIIKSESGAQVNLSLLDDGGTADGAAGDGLYSGEFTPSAAGKYTALARITGTSVSSGIAFTRQAMTSFNVVQPTSELTGTVSDQGVDDNGNSLFDRIVITTGVNVMQSGNHRLYVHLKTQSGVRITRSAERNLLAGMQSVPVSFESSAFTTLGEKGPYTIESLELDSLGATGATPSDRIINVGQTQPYQLSQFEQAPISFVSVGSVQGEDTNSNNLFDRLVVLVRVNVQTSGSYSWSLKLTDQSRREIDFSSASGTLTAGLNTIRFEFKGSAIGSSGINGPYLLRDLLVFNQTTSLVQTDAGQTTALTASQFEGFNANTSDLSITATASPGTVATGGTLTYTLTVTNNGPRSAPSVTVTNNLPSSLTYGSCSATGGGICGGTANNRTITFATLDPQATVTVTLTATVNNGLSDPTIVNTAGVSSLAADPSLSNNSATVTTPVQASSIQFTAANYEIGEGSGSILFTVTRSGGNTGAATVKYATSDPTDANFKCDPTTPGQATIYASRKCDYHITAGTLRFAAGELTKQFTISLVDDVYVEGPEAFTLTLSNPTGTSLGQNSTATVTIKDNDTYGTANPLASTAFFVRQLYIDLLSREPDPAGLQGWINRIDLCGHPGQPPPPCDRVTVGGDGFLRSGEFFDRQFFVIRLYRAGLGRILRYDDVADLAFVSGFLTTEQLELNKQDLVVDMMSRPEFANRYNSLSNVAFVATLLQTAGVTVPQTIQTNWVTALDTNAKTRAVVYREISERQEVSDKYLHEAQVVSAYYGFFTRNPDGAYLNYLQRLDSGEINLSDLANAFINAGEYRQRFGQ